MKRILNLFIITLSFLLLQVSCTEEWLTPKPLSFYAPENVYINEEGLRAILPTLRKDLKSEFYNDQNPIQCEPSASICSLKCSGTCSSSSLVYALLN
jgi:hypothetical protein